MNLLKNSLAAMLMLGFATFALAQDKVVTKQVVVKPDGTYTVIEYPVGKEITVNLLPAATISGGKGMARVIRSADGTKVFFDIGGMPATTTSFYAYAVDATGEPTLLGPMTVTNGIAQGEFTTPMNQFMLVLSPAEGLTDVTASNVIFTSEIPTGFSVIPRRVIETPVSAVASATFVSYEVPLLNVPTFGELEKTVRLRFDNELSGLDAKAHIDREKGTTKIRMEFDDMKKVPANKRFVLWAYSPDGKYTKLGQVINSGRRDNATIKTETALTDFGLLLTVEDTEVTVPTSRVFSVFRVVP